MDKRPRPPPVLLVALGCAVREADLLSGTGSRVAPWSPNAETTGGPGSSADEVGAVVGASDHALREKDIGDAHRVGPDPSAR